MTKDLDIQEFAERVERLCNFLLAKTERQGTDDLKVIEDLKEDAANIQFGQITTKLQTFEGLSDYMKGSQS